MWKFLPRQIDILVLQVSSLGVVESGGGYGGNSHAVSDEHDDVLRRSFVDVFGHAYRLSKLLVGQCVPVGIVPYAGVSGIRR